MRVWQEVDRALAEAWHMHHQVAEQASEADGDQKKFSNYSYPAMTKTQGSFRLQVEAGDFTDSEIVVMLGENGTGNLLSGIYEREDLVPSPRYCDHVCALRKP